ncbi:MAG: YceI family protein [Acidobacteriia bacterium]|nr:YceI family protein [Terriglobia bacterium]
MNASGKRALVFLAAGLAWAAAAQERAIDPQKSAMTVRVYKAGVFSAFGHDHEIAAPIARGAVDAATRRVELRVEAAALRVRDAKSSDKDRGEIQKTMVGPDVLDVEHYPEISFRSTTVEAAGPDSWKVHGSLTLHGQTQQVTVNVKEENGHYVGSAALNQTSFGIKPVAVAGGTIKVKNEIRIEFDIQLVR